MILDRQNMYSYNQAITASAVSTDVIDLGAEMWTGYAGTDREIAMEVVVTETFLAAGAATLTMTFESSKTENFASVKQHYSSAVIPKADLVLGKRITMSMKIPPDAQRYSRLNYIVATGPFTAGKLIAALTPSRQINL